MDEYYVVDLIKAIKLNNEFSGKYEIVRYVVNQTNNEINYILEKCKNGVNLNEEYGINKKYPLSEYFWSASNKDSINGISFPREFYEKSKLNEYKIWREISERNYDKKYNEFSDNNFREELKEYFKNDTEIELKKEINIVINNFKKGE